MGANIGKYPIRADDTGTHCVGAYYCFGTRKIQAVLPSQRRIAYIDAQRRLTCCRVVATIAKVVVSAGRCHPPARYSHTLEDPASRAVNLRACHPASGSHRSIVGDNIGRCTFAKLLQDASATQSFVSHVRLRRFQPALQVHCDCL